MKNDTGFSESFLLGMVAAFGGLITIVFASIRKSRCTTLRCCGTECTRIPLSEEAVLQEIRTEKNVGNNI